jgi:hypothetical protein
MRRFLFTFGSLPLLAAGLALAAAACSGPARSFGSGGAAASTSSATGGAGGVPSSAMSASTSASSSGAPTCDPSAWVYMGNDPNACAGHVGESCGWTMTNEGQGYHCQPVSWGIGCEPGGTTCPSGSTTSSSSSGGAGKIELWILPDYDNAKSPTNGVAGFISRTSVNPHVISNYMDISSGSFNTSKAQQLFDEASGNGVKGASISIKTADTDVGSATQGQIAAAVKYGTQKGLIVYIRFGYEMNGSWSPSYHNGDPSVFKNTWAEVASAVHGAGGLMIWAPNHVNSGVPAAYMPWLPTDTSTIDIVGLDAYHFNSGPGAETVSASEIQGFFSSIYPIVQQLDRPFILTETATSYYDTSGTWPVATTGEVAEKQAWLGFLVAPSLLQAFPLYRGFAWFDYNKYESNEYRDFSISQQPLEASMFTAFVNANASTLVVGP